MWWKKLPPSQQRMFWKQMRSRWYWIGGGITIIPASGVVYYVSHLEESPVTGRKRFIAFTHDQFMSICEYEVKLVSENIEYYCFSSIRIQTYFYYLPFRGN